MRQLNQAGQDLLQFWEKRSQVVYLDQAGLGTGGWGHRTDLPVGTELTDDQIAQWWTEDVDTACSGVEDAMNGDTSELNDNQFGAEVVFAFNIGDRAFQGSTVLKDVLTNDLPDVPAAMLMWSHIHDPNTGALIVSNGLLNRRNAEIALFNTPVSDGSS